MPDANLKTRLERHAKNCRDAEANDRARPALPQDIANELREIVRRGDRARLVGAILDGASLVGASLVGASLDVASLVGASLDGARLDVASLVGARLDGARLDRARWKGASGIASHEESEAMLRRIAEIVVTNPDRLDMGTWHGDDATLCEGDYSPQAEARCGTTHCLAGWAQALCETPFIRRMSPPIAGAMLIPTAAHMFYAGNEEAMEFLRARLPKAEEAT